MKKETTLKMFAFISHLAVFISACLRELLRKRRWRTARRERESDTRVCSRMGNLLAVVEGNHIELKEPLLQRLKINQKW